MLLQRLHIPCHIAKSDSGGNFIELKDRNLHRDQRDTREGNSKYRNIIQLFDSTCFSLPQSDSDGLMVYCHHSQSPQGKSTLPVFDNIMPLLKVFFESFFIQPS